MSFCCLFKRGSNPEYLKEVIVNLLATGRNHVLTKDQTTVELEKARLGTEKKNTIFKTASEFFQKKS